MNKILIYCLATSLVANAFFVFDSEAAKAEVVEVKPTVVPELKAAVPAEVDDKELNRLRAKVKSLNASLEAKNDLVAQLEEQLKAKPKVQYVSKNDWGKNFAERMKMLKEENPEEYERIKKKIEKMKQRFQEGTKTRSEFFAGFNLEGLDEKQQKAISELQEKMARIDELNERMQDGDFENQGELQMEIWNEMKGTRQLMDTARDVALDDLAKDIGYDDESSSEFTDYVDYIYDMTSFRGMFGGKGARGAGPKK